MTIELPALLTEPLEWIGFDWPQADEDRLLADGQAWIEHGTRLRRHAAEADTAARRVWLENEGAGVEAFERWWTGDDGPGRHLDDAATAVELIGAGLIAMAGVTVALKTAYIAQLTLLAFQVGQALATAAPSGGATLAEIPIFIGASRVACRQILHRALQSVEGEIAQLFKQAADLLRTAGTKAAAQHAGQLARHFGENSEFHRLMREVEKADVRSPYNGANFYSGALEDGTRMRGFADANTDGVTSVTLEKTPGGAYFDGRQLYESGSPIRKGHADDIWGRLSERYAENAEGAVTAWSHDPSPRSVWVNRELPALQSNPKVTSIEVIDPAA